MFNDNRVDNSLKNYFSAAFNLAQEEGIQIVRDGKPAHVTTLTCNTQELELLGLTPDDNLLHHHLVALAFDGTGDVIGKAIINDALADGDGLLTDDDYQMRYAAEVLGDPRT